MHVPKAALLFPAYSLLRQSPWPTPLASAPARGDIASKHFVMGYNLEWSPRYAHLGISRSDHAVAAFKRSVDIGYNCRVLKETTLISRGPQKMMRRAKCGPRSKSCPSIIGCHSVLKDCLRCKYTYWGSPDTTVFFFKYSLLMRSISLPLPAHFFFSWRYISWMFFPSVNFLLYPLPLKRPCSSFAVAMLVTADNRYAHTVHVLEFLASRALISGLIMATRLPLCRSFWNQTFVYLFFKIVYCLFFFFFFLLNSVRLSWNLWKFLNIGQSWNNILINFVSFHCLFFFFVMLPKLAMSLVFLDFLIAFLGQTVQIYVFFGLISFFFSLNFSVIITFKNFLHLLTSKKNTVVGCSLWIWNVFFVQ